MPGSIGEGTTPAPLIEPLAAAPDPLDLLGQVATLRCPAFLDGAAEPAGLGRWSYLTWDPVALLEGTAAEWPDAAAAVRHSLDQPRDPPDPDLPPFRGGWIGWLGYELGAAFDRQPAARHDPLGVPDFSLALHDVLVAWDHREGRAWLVSTGRDATGGHNAGRARARLEAAREIVQATRHAPALEGRGGAEGAARAVETLGAPAYRTAVAEVIERVLDGEIFQANLTDRFTLPFAGDRVALYRRLRARAPGSHAGFIDRGRVAALSMSPERFLRFDSVTRRVESRPIKGTRRRERDPGADRLLAEELAASTKDRAENVMIVDLLRNDLSRVAVPGTLRVEALCRLETFAAVHHLVSVVAAEVRADADALDLVAATFPGGSITGAPKLRAMKILAELEPERRGIYTGAIGWIGLDGSLDLNIAIRTVTLADGQAMVGAGGGVTLLSDPADEHAEALTKAAPLLAAIVEAS